MPFARLVMPALLCAAGLAQAATYHVAPGGSDAAPGSEAQPWATLQHAADSVGPGDTVLVHGGTYAGFELTTSGTAGQRIVFAAAPGAQPLVNGDNPFNNRGAINIEGASHVTVRGFQVSGATRAGIRAVLCKHVHIVDNVADQNGYWGILTGFCDDLLIQGNETSRSVVEHGIYVSNSGDRPVIRGNVSWGNNANGIHMNGDIDTLDEDYDGELDGIIEDALVEANVIFDNGEGQNDGPGGNPGGGSGINCDGVQDSLFRNNLIHDAHHSGISLYRIDGGGPSSGNRVYNNTVIVAANGRWALNIRDGSTGNDIRNNIFYSEHGFRGAMTICEDCLDGMTSDHNAVEDRFTLDDGDSILTLAQWQAATGLDANSVASTPAALFTDAASDDYTLAPGSPAHDAGQHLPAVPTDILDTPRPQGAAHDIGAYETPDPATIFRDGFES